MLSFLNCLLLKFNTDFQIENYHHHDGEQWGFNRKVDTMSIWMIIQFSTFQKGRLFEGGVHLSKGGH